MLLAAHPLRLPAGSALAVDRERFAAAVTEAIESLPGLTLVREEAVEIPAGPAIVAIYNGAIPSRMATADLEPV